jgi:7,8-dihydropterin-6-yl-methyl-4-(beta-D-ribofuranosyl)aminobenzene 5'-phosphate synthase
MKHTDAVDRLELASGARPVRMRRIAACVAAILMLAFRAEISFADSEADPDAADMARAMATDFDLREMVAAQRVSAATLLAQFKANVAEAETDWLQQQSTIAQTVTIGSTRRFELTPLIEWFAAYDGLQVESGVSYLIRTDDATILFDLGLNSGQTDPSPLLKNMTRLGIGLQDVDAIVISHPHSDHVGGGRWLQEGTFSLSGRQIALGHCDVYTPVPMQYPGLQICYSAAPTRITKGVATSGVIQCPMFFGGNLPEQALVVNVEGKGIVVVTGCGHPTIEKLMARARTMFKEPLYAILGGFHLPVAEGRNIGHHFQFYFTGRLPWLPLRESDVEALAQEMKITGIRCVGVSSHDSSDDAIDVFRRTFGPDYMEMKVGETVALR